MQVTIQGEILTVTEFIPHSKNSLLFTESIKGIVKIFRFYVGGCKLIAQFNKNSIDEIEHVENQLKILKTRGKNNGNKSDV